MSTAHTGRSLLLVWLLKKKRKERGGKKVFLVSSVQDYNTRMHKLTQAGHRRDRLAQVGTDRAWSRPPPAVGAAPSTRFGCTRFEALGTVVRLFPKEEQTKPHPRKRPTRKRK